MKREKMGQSMRFISEESSFVLKMWVWFVLVVTTLSFGGIIGLVWWVIVPFSIVLYFLLGGKKGRILNHFEIMDHPSCPQTISFYIQDALILLWSVQFQLKPPTSHLETLSSHFQQKGLEKIDMVVLASGGGGAEIFYQREFRKEKLESQVILTDLFPNVDRWRVMEKICSNQKITHLPRPVDALDCDVKCDVRSMSGALHHFTPDLVQRLFPLYLCRSSHPFRDSTRCLRFFPAIVQQRRSSKDY